MATVYGYCRISTKQQNIERQVRNIRAACPDAVIVQEAFTGTKVEGRKEFERLLRIVRPGDTIVFDSVSRMSRNAEIGFYLYRRFFDAGITLIFLKEPQINTQTYRDAMDHRIDEVKTGDKAADELVNAITKAVNTYMLRLAEKQIELAFEQAQKEVDDLHQRTREGIATARLAGKQIGGVAGKKLTVKKEAPAKELIRRYSKDFDGTLNDTDCLKLVGISRNTYYKYKKELKDE